MAWDLIPSFKGTHKSRYQARARESGAVSNGRLAKHELSTISIAFVRQSESKFYLYIAFARRMRRARAWLRLNFAVDS